MQITLNETTAAKVTALTTESVDAARVIDLAVDTLTWAKTAQDNGKTVIAATSGEDGKWVEEEFYPAAEVLTQMYTTAAVEEPVAE